MPDISMCNNQDCPKKETCYRFIAKPNIHQSYTKFEFNGNCMYYLKSSLIKNKKILHIKSTKEN
jgi:hypothetical protein